jgi:hypothetical protein
MLCKTSTVHPAVDIPKLKREKMIPSPFSSQYNRLASIKYKQCWRMKYFLSSLHPRRWKLNVMQCKMISVGLSFFLCQFLCCEEWGPCFSDICLTVIGQVLVQKIQDLHVAYTKYINILKQHILQSDRNFQHNFVFFIYRALLAKNIL